MTARPGLPRLDVLDGPLGSTIDDAKTPHYVCICRLSWRRRRMTFQYRLNDPFAPAPTVARALADLLLDASVVMVPREVDDATRRRRERVAADLERVFGTALFRALLAGGPFGEDEPSFAAAFRRAYDAATDDRGRLRVVANEGV